MFTGLIEALGTVESHTEITPGRMMQISAPFTHDLTRGESVATNGVCLTVVEIQDGVFSVEVMPETLRLTTLGELKPGDRLNLERSLTPNTRLGGHIVQGHVDGLAVVCRAEFQKPFAEIDFQAPRELLPLIAYKGSIAIEGVSLTVSRVSDTGFGVSLIPQTLSDTTLGELKVGQTVNVETDLLAKHLQRLMQFQNGGKSE